MKGFGVHDREGGALYDPQADQGFIEAISAFEGTIKIRKVNAHVLDEKFADAVMEAFLENVALAADLDLGWQPVRKLSAG